VAVVTAAERAAPWWTTQFSHAEYLKRMSLIGQWSNKYTVPIFFSGLILVSLL
jgi:hypothetical protein